MSPANPTPPWNLDARAAYVPLSHEGAIVAFCKPDYAVQIVQQLNEVERLEKALQLACYDLVARMGSSSDSVSELVQHYLARVNRPVRGTELIAMMLKDRQKDLDLNQEEFAKFCDSYRLSRTELKDIYSGQDVESHQLIPIARILGISVDEVINAWKGDD